MATRTIAKFRAEHEIWRKDLATVLEVPEEELERLETAEEVPPEIAAKITEAYHLPPDYFTVDFEAEEVKAREAVKALPKSPFRYFFGVALVWRLVFGLISAAVLLPSKYFSAFGFEVASLYFYLETVCTAVITLVSGIYLSSYIRKKTKFYGDILNYEFLYPYLSSMASAWVTSLFNWLVLQILNQATYFYNSLLLALPSAVIGLIISALFTAALLETAITEPEEKKTQRLRLLLGAAVGSYILATVFSFLAYGPSGGEFSPYLSYGTEFFLLGMVVVCTFIGAKQAPDRRKRWLTIPPAIALLLPQLISIYLAGFGI